MKIQKNRFIGENPKLKPKNIIFYLFFYKKNVLYYKLIYCQYSFALEIKFCIYTSK